MNRIIEVPVKKSTNRKEVITKQRQYNGIPVVNAIQTIDDFEARVFQGRPTVVDEGLLIPFSYAKTIQAGKLTDTLYYLLIDKETLREAYKLIRDEDDGK